MKPPIAFFIPILLIVIILIHIVAIAEAGGHPIPGGTILDIGDCRSRFCPRNTLGMDPLTTNSTTATARPRPHPLRTVEELFGFGVVWNYKDNKDDYEREGEGEGEGEEGEEEEEK